MAGPCSENVFRPKFQDTINMGTRRQTPKRTAKRDVAKNDRQGEREHFGFKTWREAEVAAKDRVALGRRIDGPILHEERRKKWRWKVQCRMRKPTYCTLIANLKVEITLSIKIPCFHRSSWPVSIRHLHNRELESCDKTHVRTGRVAQPECKRIHRHGFLSFNEKNKITNSITWCCCLALQLENLYMISRELFYKIKIRSLNQSAKPRPRWENSSVKHLSWVFSVVYSNVGGCGNNVSGQEDDLLCYISIKKGTKMWGKFYRPLEMLLKQILNAALLR